MLASEGFLSAADGVRLYFRTIGDGPRTLVFPNGIYLAGDFARLAEGRKLIFYDVRNRGLSETIGDVSKLKRGINNDVDDLDAVRKHFGIEKLDVVGHSYIGVMVVLYAMTYPGHPIAWCRSDLPSRNRARNIPSICGVTMPRERPSWAAWLK